MTKLLTLAEAQDILASRKTLLETIKPSIGLKSYYKIAEKLNQELKSFETLLNIEAHKNSQAAQYSFALDSQFFEQKFFTN